MLLKHTDLGRVLSDPPVRDCRRWKLASSDDAGSERSRPTEQVAAAVWLLLFQALGA